MAVLLMKNNLPAWRCVTSNKGKLETSQCTRYQVIKKQEAWGLIIVVPWYDTQINPEHITLLVRVHDQKALLVSKHPQGISPSPVFVRKQMRKGPSFLFTSNLLTKCDETNRQWYWSRKMSITREQFLTCSFLTEHTQKCARS